MTNYSKLPSLKLLKQKFVVENGCLFDRETQWEAGWDDRGRRRVKIDGKSYFVSRIIFKMAHRRDPVGIVDHIDGDSLNDKIKNLREATDVQSAHNTSTKNSTGIRGITYRENRLNPFRARITIAGKNHDLGSFPTLKSAQKALQRKIKGSIVDGYRRAA